jgi:hypothetical protein
MADEKAAKAVKAAAIIAEILDMRRIVSSSAVRGIPV